MVLFWGLHQVLEGLSFFIETFEDLKNFSKKFKKRPKSKPPLLSILRKFARPPPQIEPGTPTFGSKSGTAFGKTWFFGVPKKTLFFDVFSSKILRVQNFLEKFSTVLIRSSGVQKPLQGQNLGFEPFSRFLTTFHEVPNHGPFRACGGPKPTEVVSRRGGPEPIK